MWHYVYILENEHSKHYVGLTDNVNRRLAEHNRGKISSTAKYCPWKLAHFAGFPDRKKAAEYERYLKSGSGRSFRKRHLYNT